MFKYVFWNGAVLCLLIFVSSPVVIAQEGEDDSEEFDNCSAYTKKNFGILVKGAGESLVSEYGKESKDSVNVFLSRLQKLYDTNKLFVQAPTGIFKEDTASLESWLSSVLKGQKSAADSIHSLAAAITGSYVNAEHNYSSEKFTDAEIYYGIRKGNIQGDYANFADYICKLALHFPEWGVPVKCEVQVPLGDKEGKVYKAHSWVGFYKSDAGIWCMVDVAAGSIVIDSKTNSAISFDSLKTYMRDAEKWKRVTVTPVEQSCMSSPACIFSFLLRADAKATYFKSGGAGSGFVKAAYITPLESTHYTLPFYNHIWKNRNYPAISHFNFYCEIPEVIVYSNVSETLYEVKEIFKNSSVTNY